MSRASDRACAECTRATPIRRGAPIGGDLMQGQTRDARIERIRAAFFVPHSSPEWSPPFCSSAQCEPAAPGKSVCGVPENSREMALLNCRRSQVRCRMFPPTRIAAEGRYCRWTCVVVVSAERSVGRAATNCERLHVPNWNSPMLIGGSERQRTGLVLLDTVPFST